MAARRSSMTTCARSGRCSSRRGPISGRSIGRARSASSISGSPAARCRSGTVRAVGAGWSLRVWVTHVPGQGAGLLQGNAGLADGHQALSVVVGGAAADVGLGPPGRSARERSSSDRGVRGVLRQLAVGWHFCAPRDPQAKGCVERLQDCLERSFEPGRVFANELDYQAQLDLWFTGRANARIHKTLKARPIDRLVEERGRMAPLPQVAPDTDRRWVLRVTPDPYLRFDTCDYSLDPRLVGRRVEVRVSAREVLAVALDTGELACRHARSFARHRTITAIEHARALMAQRDERRQSEPIVEVRRSSAMTS